MRRKGGGAMAWRLAAVLALWAGMAFGADLSACPPGQTAPAVAHAPRLAPGAVVLAIGSSSTAGYGALRGEDYPSRLAALTGARVENAGRGGERAAGALTRLRALLAAGRYDLVIWQLGMNDARDPAVTPQAFAATLDEGVAAIRAAGAAALLVDQQAYPDPPDPARHARFVALVAEGAARNAVALLPRHAAMAAWPPETLAAMLAADRFHMNARGYACLAALIAAALGR